MKDFTLPEVSRFIHEFNHMLKRIDVFASIIRVWNEGTPKLIVMLKGCMLSTICLDTANDPALKHNTYLVPLLVKGPLW